MRVLSCASAAHDIWEIQKRGMIFPNIMIFGKSGLQRLPTRVALFPWAYSRQGATGFPLLTTWDSVAGLGRAPIPENISGRKLTRVLNSAGSVLVHLRYVTKRPRTGEGCDPGNSGVWDRDYGWGVRVRRHFGARGMSSVRYRTRLGDLKNKQSTERGRYGKGVRTEASM